MSSAISFATSVRGCPVVGRRAHVARRVAPVVTRCNADIMSEVGSLRLTENQLQASRYVASNRFKLQKNKGPTFEKRWAERKSRLANLDGFRFFTLMRRVEASAGGMGGPPTAAYVTGAGRAAAAHAQGLGLMNDNAGSPRQSSVRFRDPRCAERTK